MKYLFSLALASITLTSCKQADVEMTIVRTEKHRIVQVFRNRPVSVHDEISPRWKAVLDNGDTVSCNQLQKPGDTITYQFYGPTN
jgi:hypothetical protein